ncbi:hypothetical protein FQR65_LT05730 [Abscondita terminalis]|nr:hypothetical protein FQR65_LT05730 [Abscondita terminalis]
MVLIVKNPKVVENGFGNYFKKFAKDPENFFKNAFVYNHCPIGMLSDSGANYTPVRLEVTIREEVIKICDETLLEVIKLLQPNIIVGVGRRAESRCKRIVKQNKLSNDVKVIYLLHPSPLTRQSKNWVEKTEKSLEDLKLIRYFDGSKTEET